MEYMEYLKLAKEEIKSGLSPVSSDLAAFDELWEETDFSRAPASAKYHLAIPHGLFIHSHLVWGNAVELNTRYGMSFSDRELLVCSIFHDLCKTDLYIKEQKWKKDESTGNRWQQYMAWDHKDQLPLGHGEKSLYLAQRLFSLTDLEAMAIRWHMGAYDASMQDYAGRMSLNDAMKNPLVRLINLADLMTGMQEKKEAFFNVHIGVGFKFVLNPDLTINYAESLGSMAEFQDLL